MDRLFPNTEPRWQAVNPAVHSQCYGANFVPMNGNIASPCQGARMARVFRNKTNNQFLKGAMIPTLRDLEESLHVWSGINYLGVHKPTPYTYRGLEDGKIRLFILFTGKQQEQLRGMICVLPFSQTISYQTLSYAWGPTSQPMHTIMTPEGTISVTASVHSALLRLRPKQSALSL